MNHPVGVPRRRFVAVCERGGYLVEDTRKDTNTYLSLPDGVIPPPEKWAFLEEMPFEIAQVNVI